ncbi:MAG: Trk system potassium transporter TrkA [Lachnospiraceae bacterium]|nr:Trk system potassium transporter TrkA [Lachnospiraceae bacterium]
MKIAIAGCGKVGTTLAEQLSKENHDITVIDLDEERLSYISDSQDVMCCTGDARSVSVLKEAGVDTDDLLLAVMDNDEVNLMVCLVASKLGTKHTIARVRNPIYRDTINVINSDLGLSMVVNPEMETAREMFNSLRFHSAIQVETFAKSRNEILTCEITGAMPICGIKIKDLYSATKTRVFICAIKRAGEVFIPNGETQINSGDTLSFVANHADAEKFFKKLGNAIGSVRNLAIIGGGRLGYYLGRMAIENSMPVTIIDENKEICRSLSAALPSANIICGDATNTNLLEEEGILKYSAVATVTGEDSVNLLISMYLKKNAPDTKVITKIKKSDFEDLMFNMNVGAVFNPKYIAADHILRYVRAMQNVIEDEVQSLCHVIDNKVEILEFLISQDASFIGKPIKDLKLKKDLLLANITRQGKSFTPGGNDTIEAGDTILVATTKNGIFRIADIFN